MSKNTIILASQSKYKRSQISILPLNIRCVDPNLIEDHSNYSSVQKLAEQLALEKAKAVSKTNPNLWVVGSDQTAITVDNRLITKPGDKEKAVQQLLESSGQLLYFYSAAALVKDEFELCWSVETRVKFRELSLAEINRYITIDNPIDCAGSFKVESLGISLFEKISSDDPSALIGLPMISLCRNLRKVGFSLP